MTKISESQQLWKNGFSWRNNWNLEPYNRWEGMGGCYFSQELLDTVHGFIGLFLSVSLCDPVLYTSFLVKLGQNAINSGAGVQQIQGDRKKYKIIGKCINPTRELRKHRKSLGNMWEFAWKCGKSWKIQGKYVKSQNKMQQRRKWLKNE